VGARGRRAKAAAFRRAGGERVGMGLSAACRKSGICGKQKPYSPLKVGKSRFSLLAGESLGRIVGETVSLEPCFSSETAGFQYTFFCNIILQKAVGCALLHASHLSPLMKRAF